MFYIVLNFLKKCSISHLFLELYLIPIFRRCMFHNRFLFLLKHICFDSVNSKPYKFERERFVATQDFFEICYGNFVGSIILKDYSSLDEALYVMLAQVAFKQNNPKNLAMYGILLKSISSACYSYKHQSYVYCCKTVGKPSGYFVTWTLNCIKTLVIELR